MKVAVVHDWLTGQRGGEHVLAAVLELLPTADVFCVTHVPGSVDASLDARVRGTSWLAKIPILRSRPGLALPLLAYAIYASGQNESGSATPETDWKPTTSSVSSEPSPSYSEPSSSDRDSTPDYSGGTGSSTSD